MGTDGKPGDGGGRHARLLGVLIALAVIVLNLAVAGTAELFLQSRLDDAESSAAATTQSIAHALDGSVSNAAQVTKLAVRMLVTECESEMQSTGEIEPAKLNAYFRAMRTSLPAGTLLHVTNASGRVIFGPMVGNARPLSYSDRDFFAALMGGRASPRIWVTNLLRGRATQEEVIAFVARYDDTEGRPEGVVSVAIPQSYFQALLQVPSLGPHGIALMRDASTALIASYPASKVEKLGNRHFSSQLAQVIKSGERAQTFHAVHTGDGIERIDSFRRLSGLPFYLVVGKSAEDYLATWRSTRRWVLFAQLGFLVVSTSFAAMLWSVVRRLHGIQRDEARRARRDVLTGLPNRLALMEHLPSAIARARRSGSWMAVGLLDLDDFKAINDGYGHAAGDNLLIALGRRLQGLVRAGDFVARLGGDEFLFVFEGLSPSEAQLQLDRALHRIHQAGDASIGLGAGQQVRIGMSMGIALFPHDGDHADALLRHADAAMYEVKQKKGKRLTWWSTTAPQVGAAT